MSNGQWKDHFSGHAASYAEFRPRYPDALFSWLADNAPARRVAWDAATGNGQAAVGLARHFERVIATDASRQQIANAVRPRIPYPVSPISYPVSRISYVVSSAESSGLPASSVELVTVAQALHWLDPAGFFEEAKRVLVPGGLVAVWTYVEPALDDPALDAVLQEFAGAMRPWWPPERAITETGYRGVAFPFREIEAPAFEMSMVVTKESLAGYLRTWSATRRHIAARGSDPVDDLEKRLAAVWPDGARKKLSWAFHLRAGWSPGL